MDNIEIIDRAEAARERALKILEQSRIVETLSDCGLRVNLVGSLRMGLLASHRDIDLHVYSSGVTVEKSFAIMAHIADNPDVVEIRCINGLDTDEHCIAWHVYYKAAEGEVWQIDIIHIEIGTEFDGYFERMADRIVEVMTLQQRQAILRLKFETPDGCDYHGVEYYEAVIADGVMTFEDFEKWIKDHRSRPARYWIP